MKVIETNGITHLEKFDTSSEWYWGTDYACGDLYEAEEVFQMGKRFEPNRLIFVHDPEGTVYEPIAAKEKQYFGTPACIEGKIYFLLVNFEEKMIRVFEFLQKEAVMTVEISLDEVKDCYNLGIAASPMMIVRQGGEDRFQVIWPEKADFPIGARESFGKRVDDKLYFSEWHEDPGYREEVNVRAFPSGELLAKINGTFVDRADGEHWILR